MGGEQLNKLNVRESNADDTVLLSNDRDLLQEPLYMLSTVTKSMNTRVNVA